MAAASRSRSKRVASRRDTSRSFAASRRPKAVIDYAIQKKEGGPRVPAVHALSTRRALAGRPLLARRGDAGDRDGCIKCGATCGTSIIHSSAT